MISTTPMEPCFLTAAQAVQAMRSGDLLVEDMAKSLLKRIEKRDDEVKAWAYLDPQLILQRARELDAVPKEQRGLLHGLPVGVKDVIHTIDMPTQHNSPIYAQDAPKIDAAPVMSLRAQGALIFGKTTTTEFAATGRGHPAMNPYDSSRTPGGSSSGSGAAVGDFQCTVGFGTQTIGSTIRPGSFNNIFAMKPTWNAISREGLKMLAVSLDTLGLYGRSAEDLELLLDGFRVYDDVTPTPRPISEMKIAVCKTSVWGESTVTPSLESVFQQGIDLLKAAGAEVLELDLPAEFDGALKASLNTMWTEAKSAFLGDALRCPEDLHDEFKAHVENRKGITRAEQLAGYDLLNKLMPEFDTIASKYDAILTPSVTGEAPLGIDATGNASFCGMWTGLHMPVINIPGFAGETGMPIGLSIVSGRYTDRKLVTSAKEIAKVFSKAHGGRIRKLPGVPESLL